MKPTPIIALLTDFGLSDGYVGTMKGVALSICPTARLVDITHAIQPQNVRQAAYVLMASFRYFPPDTIFVVVIDPGVGTAREAVAVATDYGTYVAPNNGVLSYVLPGVQVRHAVVLQNQDYALPGASATFHGRDIFIPAAAHLARGVPIVEFGPAVPELVELPPPRLHITPARIEGEVLHVDHFGNAITSIGHLEWTGPATLQLTAQFSPARDESLSLDAARCQVTVGGRTLSGIERTYGAVPPGDPLALVGSAGQLEIGVNQGSATAVLGVAPGDAVYLDFAS